MPKRTGPRTRTQQTTRGDFCYIDMELCFDPQLPPGNTPCLGSPSGHNSLSTITNSRFLSSHALNPT